MTRWFNTTLTNKLQTLLVCQNNIAGGILASGWTDNHNRVKQLFDSYFILECYWLKGAWVSVIFFPPDIFIHMHLYFLPTNRKVNVLKLMKIKTWKLMSWLDVKWNFRFFSSTVRLLPLFCDLQLRYTLHSLQDFLDIYPVSLTTSFRKCVYDQKA